jgi:hypothetical protein
MAWLIVAQGHWAGPAGAARAQSSTVRGARCTGMASGGATGASRRQGLHLGFLHSLTTAPGKVSRTRSHRKATTEEKGAYMRGHRGSGRCGPNGGPALARAWNVQQWLAGCGRRGAVRNRVGGQRTEVGDTLGVGSVLSVSRAMGDAGLIHGPNPLRHKVSDFFNLFP